jgi:hypothetical protein
MGIVMIRCPTTGRPVSTGIEAERETFRSTPVFFSHMYCSLCQRRLGLRFRRRSLRPALRVPSRLGVAGFLCSAAAPSD